MYVPSGRGDYLLQMSRASSNWVETDYAFRLLHRDSVSHAIYYALENTRSNSK